jgi:hypothetical protein
MLVSHAHFETEIETEVEPERDEDALAMRFSWAVGQYTRIACVGDDAARRAQSGLC